MRLTSKQQALTQLEALRQARGLNKTDFARAAGYSDNHYLNLAHGGGMSIDALIKYFEVVGIQIQLAPLSAVPRERIDAMTERKVSSERVGEERLRELLSLHDIPRAMRGGAYLADNAEFVAILKMALRSSVKKVGVKPLVWSQGWGERRAATPFGDYRLLTNTTGHFDWYSPAGERHWASTEDAAKAAAQADFERRILSAIEAPAAEGEVVIELKMTPIEDRLPTRDEMCGEQTILTYNDKVGTWDISFMEAGWGEFGAGFALGVTHWLDITNMWPGIIAQVASFTPSPAAASEVTEEMVKALERIEADCRSTIERYNRNGPSFTSPSGDEYEPTSFVIDKLNELADIATAALKGDRS